MSQQVRLGPLLFEARSFPWPTCTVTHDEDGFLLRAFGWTRKSAKRQAGMIMVQYGYWPPWLSVPEDIQRRTSVELE